MIETLTEEQEKLIPVYRDKWLEIGLNTDRIDPIEAERIIKSVYTKLLNNMVIPRVIILNDPIQAWEMVVELNKGTIGTIDPKEKDIIINKIYSSITSMDKDKSKTQDNKQIDFIWPWLDGNFSSSTFSFYNYLIEVLNLKLEKELLEKYMVWEETSKLSLIYPFSEVCVLSQKPSKIKMTDKKLHCETGPAIEYSSGFSIYCLNGVLVPKKLVEAVPEEIDPLEILKESNVEVRREYVRKIGIDNMITKMECKRLDTVGDYELYRIPIGENQFGNYLKMKNPSIQTYHFEGVPPECDSVEKALAWRDGENEYIKPSILT